MKMEKYKKIASEIIAKIENKTFQIGFKLPTESQLTKQYGASRHTVRSALDYLQTLGYIHTRKGSGSYVSNDKNYRALDMISLSDTHRNLITNEIIDFEVFECKDGIENIFELPKGNQLIRFTRLRKRDGVPYQLEITTVPKYLFTDLTVDTVKGSFYSYVENDCGYRISHGLKEISAVNLNPNEASHLEANEGDAAIVIFNKGYLSSGEIFEMSTNIHINQSFKLYARRL
jgi:DNA-binding GntR family transcriptional regulator